MTSAEDEYGQLLLRPLDTEPPPVSTVSIAKALADGRKLRRLRRIKMYCAGTATAVALVAAAGLVIAPHAPGRERSAAPGGLSVSGDASGTGSDAPGPVAAVPTSGPLPSSCTVLPLEIPGGYTTGEVLGADPTGRYAVGTAGATDPEVIFWDNGKGIRATVPGQDPELRDVNRNGVAVGTSRDDGGYHAWIYRDGRATELAGPNNATADNIGAGGAIIGHVYEANRYYPVFWQSPQEKARPLALPAGATNAVVRDVDDNGRMVGHVETKPWLWEPSGFGHELPLPKGVQSVSEMWIRGDWVSANDADSGLGIRWNLSTDEVITTEINSTRRRNSARPINAQGWMVANDREGRPFLTAPDQSPFRLPLLSSEAPSTSEYLNYAVELSDEGRTVYGNSYDKGLKAKAAVVWRCQ
ncbi:hypothetical protein Val02_13550 [Virgisporangium aliadipatigenens]|uniref:Uncharacterized protein n=1 Tax=Virgisporangium aliadipatigenens TaxID=741659 RepID=A0A8J4DNI9_9ACTN|nr:hypothetical protein [Virgisporangium aliadipatigenens]GIJ44469.1 hypothetical protein Val02_13550 [Virgisporangium aliadipatigenens]